MQVICRLPTMRMRKKGIRGQTIGRRSGDAVIFLEDMTDPSLCKVLLSGETITVIAKADLLLPVIDTKEYEKLGPETLSD